jgi:hypothetical protein
MVLILDALLEALLRFGKVVTVSREPNIKGW